MRDDIRKKTVIIIRRNNEYLVGMTIFADIRWSIYPYDAWQTRDRNLAEEIAKEVGGITMLFNPVVRQIRVL